MNTTIPPNGVAVLGIPSDENSSFMRGPMLGPQRIREALYSGATNMTTEQGFDLETDGRWATVGDLELTSGTAVLDEITVCIPLEVATRLTNAPLVIGQDADTRT